MLQIHVPVMLMLATYWLTIVMPILPYICCHVSMQTCDRHHLYFTKATRLNTQACGGGRDVISIVNFIHESFLPSQSCLYGCMSVILHVKAANYIGALQHVNNNTAAVATAYSWCLLSIPQLWVHHQDLPQSPHRPHVPPHAPHCTATTSPHRSSGDSWAHTRDCVWSQRVIINMSPNLRGKYTTYAAVSEGDGLLATPRTVFLFSAHSIGQNTMSNYWSSSFVPFMSYFPLIYKIWTRNRKNNAMRLS